MKTESRFSLTRRREPYRFMVWLGILGILLIFGILSLIYLRLKGNLGWTNFPLPRIFWVSTVFIVLSSFTLQSAGRAFVREKFTQHRWLLGLTIALGVAFVGSQGLGWSEMVSQQISLQGVQGRRTAAGAFVYVFSGLHLLHIAVGLVLLGSAFVGALRRKRYIDAFVYSVNPPNQLKLGLVSLYWHFVDGLWLYLFAFLLYHHR